jgi:hypothetical protein
MTVYNELEMIWKEVTVTYSEINVPVLNLEELMVPAKKHSRTEGRP